jgi:hypothetical protein
VRNFLTSFGPAPARGNSLVVSLDHFGDLPIGFIFRVGLGLPVDKLKFLARWSSADDEDWPNHKGEGPGRDRDASAAVIDRPLQRTAPSRLATLHRRHTPDHEKIPHVATRTDRSKGDCCLAPCRSEPLQSVRRPHNIFRQDHRRQATRHPRMTFGVTHSPLTMVIRVTRLLRTIWQIPQRRFSAPIRSMVIIGSLPGRGRSSSAAIGRGLPDR